MDERPSTARDCDREDLVAAVDVVVTKPGYGIIAECVANRAAMLYTSRGRFATYDVLVREPPRFLRSAFIDHEALFADGVRHWTPSGPLGRRPGLPPTNGAGIVAEMMAREVRGQEVAAG